ncbi:hypothetical protein JMJ77_0007817 [Colletotrichum scovillei]|uniref:Uncharacterized protein n=1 Tax=Colletotrichum scovillei TaxID=1209932 RepID=A0A9P7RDJ8_9PEZI|nr:hypothetical protein JMJ77_0007817 [Colletotrichum scovillei]KAG7074827.1 hypothetical protein JMJ76_0011296 [Colletotrichum scovillei]KAG7081948.1 hypothetical protein JMJ78_0004059 [Colletotrichum scovillei]
MQKVTNCIFCGICTKMKILLRLHSHANYDKLRSYLLSDSAPSIPSPREYIEATVSTAT